MDRIRAGAFRFIAERIESGVDELAVRDWMRDEFARAELVTDSGPIVGVNAHAGDPHYEPTAATSVPIRRGDFVLIDMWAKLDRPHSVYYDITWTGCCGDPKTEFGRVFDIVREARDCAIRTVTEAVRAGRGIRGYELDDAARIHITASGFGERFVHRTGHSIGEEVHGAGANMDNLETHDERRIVPGSLFSIEPGIYLPDFGVRSEVNVFVGKGDARVTGEMQTELVRIID